jgi:membrane-anchored protein YejM (alkaline phosphatase superfamily)
MTMPLLPQLILVLLGVLSLASCARSRPAGPPNVLLVSIDTLRADHLGTYGYARDTLPELDRLAAESIVFKNAVAPAPRTLPSHVMMLTGRHPYPLGISRGGEQSAIPAEVRIVSEYLQDAGYQTVAFVDSVRRGWLASQRGFGRDFDAFHHAPHRDGLFYMFDAAGSVDAAEEWLGQRERNRPFFMFLHTKSVHTLRWDTPRPDDRIFPYDKPEPYRFHFLSDQDTHFKWSSPHLGAGTLYLDGLNEAYYAGTMDPGDFPEERIETLKSL